MCELGEWDDRLCELDVAVPELAYENGVQNRAQGGVGERACHDILLETLADPVVGHDGSNSDL